MHGDNASKATRYTLASAVRFTAPSSVRSCHGKVGCACKHSSFFFSLSPSFFFFQGCLSFPFIVTVTVDRGAARRNDPILVHENAIIPVNRLSKRTKERKATEREEK